MRFTSIHPTTGARETMQHVEYTVTRTGPQTWEARRRDDKRLVARSYVSEAHLRQVCDSATEPAARRCIVEWTSHHGRTPTGRAFATEWHAEQYARALRLNGCQNVRVCHA